MESLPRQERTGAAEALVRRYHSEALRLRGEQLTSSDTKWIERFLNFKPAHDASEYALNDVIARNGSFDRKLFQELVLERLRSKLGYTPMPHGNATEWKFVNRQGPLRLDTFVDFGGRRLLTYSQQVVSDSTGERVYGISSFMQWHGIAAATSWDLLTAEEIGGCADTLAEICHRFDIAFADLVRRVV